MSESAQTGSPAAEAPVAKPKGMAERLVSLDAFRGMVMILMLGEGMRLPVVARAFPHSAIWSVIAFNTDHVDWQGCSLHDLIQPAFSFLVGAALPFSIASRKMKGESFRNMFGHTVRRAFILIFLGIFLRSLTSPRALARNTRMPIPMTPPQNTVIMMIIDAIAHPLAFQLYIIVTSSKSHVLLSTISA